MVGTTLHFVVKYPSVNRRRSFMSRLIAESVVDGFVIRTYEEMIIMTDHRKEVCFDWAVIRIYLEYEKVIKMLVKHGMFDHYRTQLHTSRGDMSDKPDRLVYFMVGLRESDGMYLLGTLAGIDDEQEEDHTFLVVSEKVMKVFGEDALFFSEFGKNIINNCGSPEICGELKESDASYEITPDFLKLETEDGALVFEQSEYRFLLELYSQGLELCQSPRNKGFRYVSGADKDSDKELRVELFEQEHLRVTIHHPGTSTVIEFIASEETLISLKMILEYFWERAQAAIETRQLLEGIDMDDDDEEGSAV